MVERDVFVKEKVEPGFSFGAINPLILVVIIIIAVVVSVLYAMARGVIPSPIKQSQVKIADRGFKCNECGKKIKKGKEYYHCACGAKAHIKCAKKAELCECLRRVRIDE
jgi:hypothetical protein